MYKFGENIIMYRVEFIICLDIVGNMQYASMA